MDAYDGTGVSEFTKALDTFGGFCEDNFWDNNKTWEGSWPQFSSCFQSTALIWIPCGYLWLVAPFYMHYLSKLPRGSSGTLFTKLFLGKLTCICMLVILSLVDVMDAVGINRTSGSSQLSANVFGPAVMGVTYILSCVFLILEQKRRFVTSGVLFFFFLFLAICNVIPLYTEVELQIYDSDLFTFSTLYIRYFFILLELFLLCWAQKPMLPQATVKKPSPEMSASFPSRLTFWWLNRLMTESYKVPLTENSMAELHPRDRCKTAVSRFLKNWNKTLQNRKKHKSASEDARGHPRPTRVTLINQETEHEASPLLVDESNKRKRYNGEAGSSMKKEKRSDSPIIFTLFKTFWVDVILSQVTKLFYDVLILCNPLILGELVDFVEERTSEDWHGYVLAGILLLSTFTQTLLFHQTFHFSTSLGLRIRAALISSVFRKALTMDNYARKESTKGEVVNLMSVDAGRIESTLIYVWAIWSSPLQIAVSLYLLYRTIGVSMFAGAAFLLLLIPANGVVTAKVGHLQAKLMRLKDERMKVMNELFNGIKIVKLFAWEKSFEKRVLAIRDRELKTLRSIALLGALLQFSWSAAPFIVSLLTFLCYLFVSEDHYLDPRKAFVSMSCFNILRYAINFAPMIITDIIKATISAWRIGHFLCHDDLDKKNISHSERAEYPIIVENGCFHWSEELGLALKNINLTVEDNSLTAVVGTVGSGKSSLLSALLGDMNKVSGSINIRGTIAYVPQQAWIQNDTLRNNILFGKPMDQALYDRCIKACALQPDLEILAAGDLTEIGERGINLSGGQKQRVSLARAVYAQKDIYLLDDPLSAVDSHVGKHIFNEVLSSKGMLRGKVRILVTHGIQYLRHTDQIIVVTNGQISEAGHYEKLLSHNGPFAKVISTYLLQYADNDNANNDEVLELKQEVLRRLSESDGFSDEENGQSSGHSQDITRGNGPQKSLRRLSSSGIQALDSIEVVKSEKTEVELIQQRAQAALTEEEYVEQGSVKFSVFKDYAKALGIFFVVLLVFWFALYTGTDLGSLIFLSKWTDDKDLANFTRWPADSSERRNRNDFYLTVYGIFGILQTVFLICITMTQTLRSVHASRRLHSLMLSSVLRSPMAFFDTTPMGRIINRFSKDLDDIDENLPYTFYMWIDCFFIVSASFTVISYSTPLFLAFLLPILVVYYFIQRFFIATSRQLKRFEAKTRSPIYNHFSETLSGASVIRAYGVQNRFVRESENRVDSNQEFMFTNYSANRWLGVRLETLGNLIIFLASAIAVATRDAITGGIMGLSITYALDITDNLNWFVRMTSDVETQLVSVERVVEYTRLKSEAAWDIINHRSPSSWPQRGHIEVEGLSVRYREGLDLVLKSISFQVRPGEKVGLVGRTGAGKSSLTLALFRLVEPAAGRILIDNIDITSLGLHDLRSKITILPQDPVIFAGSLRLNLDPFGEYEDSSIWQALQQAHLKSFVESLPEKLDHECGEGGENLSVGQRQLLCLGRALLRKTKILILDEATAAVDMETDELLQTTIREEFADCTILTIAHRLNTVMDYDKILVLEKGEVREFDSPQALLQNTQSLFYSMAQSGGLVQ